MLACDEIAMRLAGLGELLPLLCRGECAPTGRVPDATGGPALLRAGTHRWSGVDPCLLPRFVEDPDDRPYIWDLEEPCP